MAIHPAPPCRLYECSVEAEDPDNYFRGIYFPVELGDVFKEGRYRVIHKLGWGGYATVWLARDVWKNSNVALKIIRIDADAHEHQILQHLQNSSAAHANITHPGRKNIVQLLDVGASHKCLVLEVLGMSVQSRADDHPGRRLPGKTARAVTYQIALGLDYLWKCGVAHGDLHGGNVLFTAPTTSTLSEEQIKPRLGKAGIGVVQRRDRNPSPPSMPRYLVRPATFRGSETEIRIVDLGRAFFHDDPPRRLHTPCHMRAPESLFDQPLSRYVDMWSMGCLLFEIVTGRTLIDSILSDSFSTMRGIRSHIGPPPADWIENMDDKSRDRVTRTSLRPMDLDRYLRLAYDQDDAQLLDIEDDEDEIPIEEYERPAREFTGEELDALSYTIRGLLTYNPASRGTPATLLRSPWFEGQGG